MAVFLYYPAGGQSPEELKRELRMAQTPLLEHSWNLSNAVALT